MRVFSILIALAICATSGVASRMIEALMAANRPVPEYLKDLVNAEQSLSAVRNNHRPLKRP